MRVTIFGSMAFAALLLVPAGAGDHCNGEVTTISLATETLYVEHRPGGGSPFGTPEQVLVYLESNSMPGLQSGGDGIILEDCQIDIPAYCFSEHCWHWPHDTKLYPGVQS